MKSNIATAAFLLLCILMFGFGMNSCSGVYSRDRFAYTSRDFDAHVEGRIDGDEVAIKIQNRPSATESEYNLILSFTSPTALGGLTLSRCGNGRCEARLGELILQDFKAEGLLKPFLSLIYSGEIASVSIDEDKATVISVKTDEYDLIYCFPDGYEYPQSIIGKVGDRKIELLIKSFECAP